MEFLIFSDSHGCLEKMSAALSRQVNSPDGILFLGDGARDIDRFFVVDTPIWAVRGNCDWSSSDLADKTERLLHIEGHTILLCHGHEWGVKSGLGALTAHAAELSADIVLFGHTHVPTLKIISVGEKIGDTTLSRPMHLFNPGSIGYEGSFGTLTVKGDTVLFSHGEV